MINVDIFAVVFICFVFLSVVLAFFELSSLPPSSRTRGLRRAKENSVPAVHLCSSLLYKGKKSGAFQESGKIFEDRGSAYAKATA